MRYLGYVGYMLVGLILPAMYVGSYYWMVWRGPGILGDDLVVIPYYPVPLEIFFAPWHEVDRMIRPEYWSALAYYGPIP